MDSGINAKKNFYFKGSCISTCLTLEQQNKSVDFWIKNSKMNLLNLSAFHDMKRNKWNWEIYL